MTRKLRHANALLHGLALEEFDIVIRHATALSRLSTEADWRAHASEAYTLFSARFREHAQALADAAADHDLTTSTRAYSSLVESCVECHDYLRREGVRTDPPGAISFLLESPVRSPGSIRG